MGAWGWQGSGVKKGLRVVGGQGEGSLGVRGSRGGCGSTGERGVGVVRVRG